MEGSEAKKGTAVFLAPGRSLSGSALPTSRRAAIWAGSHSDPFWYWLRLPHYDTCVRHQDEASYARSAVNAAEAPRSVDMAHFYVNSGDGAIWSEEIRVNAGQLRES